MRLRDIIASTLGGVLLASTPAIAHHSNSAYQVDEIITLEGTVTEWRWSNPHTWLMMSVENDAGEVVEWAVEGRAPGILGRAGWNRDVLRPGETVTVHASPSKDGSAVGIIARVTKDDGTVLGNRPETAAAVDAAIARRLADRRIAGKPDFSGVYYPFNPNAPAPAAAPQRQGPLPPPTRTGPTSDGSLGRRPSDPQLTPEYLAQWEVIAASRTSGSYEYDNIANCLPPGMPAMMGMAYGMEVMQTEDKITFFSEHQDALRRVYLDGRQPSQAVLDDPTYAGYSTGHWEADTLVVETLAITTKSFIDSSSPHSDQMTVHERMRLIEPDVLEDRITVIDPVALEEPWEITRTYRRAAPPDDELREFACAEGLRDAPH
ncbi:MAG TPA: DUF6152 family protein [Gammaproteobacteria bacterium]|nr:DUF6152 family protein [Gammaproteobacteria bacterium]